VSLPLLTKVFLFSFNTPAIAVTAMGFPSGVSKTTLPNHIEKSVTLLLFPCEHYAHLNKQYIKSIISKHCSECTCFNYCHYIKMLLSDLSWKKLLKAQNSLDEQEEATLTKLLCL
jgi:hypothetical protein